GVTVRRITVSLGFGGSSAPGVRGQDSSRAQTVSVRAMRLLLKKGWKNEDGISRARATSPRRRRAGAADREAVSPPTAAGAAGRSARRGGGDSASIGRTAPRSRPTREAPPASGRGASGRGGPWSASAAREATA